MQIMSRVGYGSFYGFVEKSRVCHAVCEGFVAEIAINDDCASRCDPYFLLKHSHRCNALANVIRAII